MGNKDKQLSRIIIITIGLSVVVLLFVNLFLNTKREISNKKDAIISPSSQPLITDQWKSTKVSLGFSAEFPQVVSKYLRVISNGKVIDIDLTNGKKREVMVITPKEMNWIKWDNSGRFGLLQSVENIFYIIDSSSKEIRNLDDNVISAFIDPNGKYLALEATNDNDDENSPELAIFVRNLSTQEVKKVAELDNVIDVFLDYNFSTNKFVFLSFPNDILDEGTVFVWDNFLKRPTEIGKGVFDAKYFDREEKLITISESNDQIGLGDLKNITQTDLTTNSINNILINNGDLFYASYNDSQMIDIYKKGTIFIDQSTPETESYLLDWDNRLILFKKDLFFILERKK